MSFVATQVLDQLQPGQQLSFEDHYLAEVLRVDPPAVEIQDVHGKSWTIDQGQLGTLQYDEFLSTLAAIIARKHSDHFVPSSAAFELGGLKIGDSLSDANGYLAKLSEIKKSSPQGPALIFQDKFHRDQSVFLNLLPREMTLQAFLTRFRAIIERDLAQGDDPILMQYLKNEFLPKLLAQMDYDNQRWGDTWLMPPKEGQEDYIQKRFSDYFEYFTQYGKKVPWLKIAGYAVIAHAREDHPEWLI